MYWLRSIGSEAASTPSLKYAAKLYHEPFRDENEGRKFESPNFETVDVGGTVVSLRIGDSHSGGATQPTSVTANEPVELGEGLTPMKAPVSREIRANISSPGACRIAGISEVESRRGSPRIHQLSADPIAKAGHF